MRLPSRIFFACRFISFCKDKAMRQYATFPLAIFIVNIAATLEMQTSFTEFRALYPTLQCGYLAAFFLPTVYPLSLIVNTSHFKAHKVTM